MLTQDGPQYVVHVLFLFVLRTDLDYAEFTVVISIFVSSIAIQVTICNIILGSMKEFDPVILQLELKRRKEMAQEKQDRMNQQREMQKQLMSVSKPALTRDLIQSYVGQGSKVWLLQNNLNKFITISKYFRKK